MEALVARLSDGARKRRKVVPAPSSALVAVARPVAPTRSTGDGLRPRLTAPVQNVPAEALAAGAVQHQGRDARERNTTATAPGRPTKPHPVRPRRSARARPSGHATRKRASNILSNPGGATAPAQPCSQAMRVTLHSVTPCALPRTGPEPQHPVSDRPEPVGVPRNIPSRACARPPRSRRLRAERSRVSVRTRRPALCRGGSTARRRAACHRRRAMPRAPTYSGRRCRCPRATRPRCTA